MAERLRVTIELHRPTLDAFALFLQRSHPGHVVILADSEEEHEAMCYAVTLVRGQLERQGIAAPEAAGQGRA